MSNEKGPEKFAVLDFTHDSFGKSTVVFAFDDSNLTQEEAREITDTIARATSDAFLKVTADRMKARAREILKGAEEQQKRADKVVELDDILKSSIGGSSKKSEQN